ncbi:hypothetical protein BHE90_008898 [Fusarium euwallaceae]|uniref:Uncharacterized protein n=5 Tax=Fusarium solani species complex TaxID=232080 RepID=A0A3M2RTA6_9HYPO|nr:hypothetical protein CDV36_011860 [Fusarium kuroshium]RSL78539.1 hypothetical protein CEP51_008123 [Fusarium floridanum]RSM15567.1 hypothetical protein CEP52_000720 [Fusarium oligoseptatum]RSM20851.1 hypothetical protein CDV31_000222 [Fusarium ambrosium]RTE76640.1 hypothetical protein BHE90_008898 [Fusarium euwallaceae]
MPKRTRETQDTGEKTQPPTRRNTERSHSENQERAYIAASRRADRSIEARVQSARNASEIHKKRTGKAFRITEEIVMKEEMYEEEDEEFPRSYRLLNPHMQTANPELNARVDAYLSNRVAMSKLLSATDTDWRNNEINTTFDQFFPNVNQRVRAASQQQYSTAPGFTMPQGVQSPVTTTRVPSVAEQSFNTQFQPINYGQANNERNPSSTGLPASPTETRNDVPMSPPALTPGGMSHPETPRSRHGSTFGAALHHSSTGRFNSEGSVFTTQLPAEARMLLGGVSLSNAYGTSVYNDPPQWQHQSFSFDNAGNATDELFSYSPDTKPLKQGELTDALGSEQYADPFVNMSWGTQNQGESDASAKNAPEDWEAYIDDTAWANNQQ